MEEVRGAGGPWTVAGGDPQNGDEGGELVVKCEGAYFHKMDTNGQERQTKGKWKRLVKDLVE